jgi:hypothetical protein
MSEANSMDCRVGFDAEASPRVLDPCCGGRMMWFDRQNPDVVFGDRRSETLTVTDNSRGNASGLRTIRIEPDTLLDFRALPYSDGAFKLVAFDPPHLVQAGPRVNSAPPSGNGPALGRRGRNLSTRTR